MATKVYDLLAPNGEYTGQDGQQKTRWLNCGTIFRNDTTGFLSLKLDTVPVGNSFEGWFQLREPMPKQQSQPQHQGQPGMDGFRQPQVQPQAAQPQPQAAPSIPTEQDVPF